MHPNDVQTIKDLSATCDILMRKYLVLLTDHAELGRRQTMLEEELRNGKTGLQPLWEKIDGLALRVEEVSQNV